jgi:hypothetical protein
MNHWGQDLKFYMDVGHKCTYTFFVKYFCVLIIKNAA